MEKEHFIEMPIQDKVDIYETFTIPNLKRLIVKLANDTPLNREEREMLKDILSGQKI